MERFDQVGVEEYGPILRMNGMILSEEGYGEDMDDDDDIDDIDDDEYMEDEGDDDEENDAA